MWSKWRARVGDLVVPNPITLTYLIVDGLSRGGPIPAGTPLLVVDMKPLQTSFDPHRVWLTVVTPSGSIGEVLQDAVILKRRATPVK